MSHLTSINVDTLLTRMSADLGDRIRTDDEALERASGDESGLPGRRPAAVIFLASAQEAALVAKEAAQLGVAIVPRGAGTGKAGGCIPRGGDVVLDVSRMNQIKQMRARDLFAVVQPGVVNKFLDDAAGECGLMYPPDPASRESCSIGGNIATNAGGPRALKYGVTQAYVWGLEVVLAGGDVLRMGRQSIKGVAGYSMTSMFVGSEGTLGIITEATMHLVPAPRGVETGWLNFADPQAASLASEAIFAAGIVPRMMELLDKPAIEAVRTKSRFVIDAQAGASLLVETDAASEEQARIELLRLCEIATEAGAVSSQVASSEAGREDMRRARRLVSGCLKEKFPFKLSDDIAVPRSHMPRLLEFAQEAAAQAGISSSAYGHMGDGNLHINLLCVSLEQQLAAQSVRQKVMRFAISLGGTITGEHGIGLAKLHELPLEQPELLLEWQRRLKQAFDPRWIMNPGKVLATTHA